MRSPFPRGKTPTMHRNGSPAIRTRNKTGPNPLGKTNPKGGKYLKTYE